MTEEAKQFKKEVAKAKRTAYKQGFNEGMAEGHRALAENLRELLGAEEVGHEHPEYEKESDY